MPSKLRRGFALEISCLHCFLHLSGKAVPKLTELAALVVLLP